MIDGVKVKCLGVNAKDWEANGLLVFASRIDSQTGEILAHGKRIAYYNGLQFHLIPSTVSETTHCYIKGSLAKYHTQGKTNAFDFTASMLSQAINDLRDKFGIDPTKAVLENLEFGLNILPPIEPKKVFKGLIAYKSNGFKTFSIANTTLGQCIGMPNYQTIKIYDKAKQDPTAPKNLLRLEIAVKRMSIVAKFGIKTLSDLTASKLAPLLGKILDLWNDCIYTDEKRKYKDMKGFERSKWLYYINPKKWEGLEKKQRYRMKKHFNQLNTKYGMGNTQQEIALLIWGKIKELTSEAIQKDVHLLHNFSEALESPKTSLECPPFTCLDKGVKSTPKKVQIPKEKGKGKKGKKCTVCKTDISTLKAGSKFCSKHCNNSFHASKRTAQRRAKIQGEKAQLADLLRNIRKANNWCLISYQFDGGAYSVILNQGEIYLENGVKVYRVETAPTTDFKKGFVLTSYRARKYIKTIHQLNIQKQ